MGRRANCRIKEEKLGIGDGGGGSSSGECRVLYRKKTSLEIRSAFCVEVC